MENKKKRCHLCSEMKVRGTEVKEHNLFRQEVEVFYCSKCYDQVQRLQKIFRDGIDN